MTNNIEQIEEMLSCLVYPKDIIGYKHKIMLIVKSMQYQIDALTKEADADESRESESL